LGVRKFFSRYLKEIYLFFLSVEALNSKSRLYLFFTILALSVLLVVSDGIYQYTTGVSFFSGNGLINSRVTGPFRHGNDFGTYLVTVLPVLLGFLLVSTKAVINKPLVPFKKKWPILVLFLGALFLLGVTFSRGAWLGFSCSVIFLLVTNKQLKPMWILAFLAAFFAVFIFLAASVRHDLISGGFSFEQFFSLGNRLPYWRSALILMISHPFYGAGFGNYVGSLEKMNLLPLEYPHNGFLHIAAETGLIGLAVFVGLLWTFFNTSLRQAKKMVDLSSQKVLFGLLAGLLAFLVHAFFDTALSAIKLASLMWIMMGVAFAVQNNNSNENTIKVR